MIFAFKCSFSWGFSIAMFDYRRVMRYNMLYIIYIYIYYIIHICIIYMNIMKGTLTSYNHRPSGCFFVRCHRPFPRPLRKPQRTLVLGGSQGGAAVWMWGLPSPSVPRTELMVHRFLELPLLMDLFWK